MQELKNGDPMHKTPYVYATIPVSGEASHAVVTKTSNHSQVIGLTH